MKHMRLGLFQLLCSALIVLALTYLIPSRAPAGAMSTRALVVGGTPTADTATTAMSTRALVATGFQEVALQGFGDFQNSWPWAGAWYQGRVYIGTSRNTGCVIAFRETYPPTDTQVTCPPLKQNLPPTLGAQIWSVDPTSAPVLTQTNWTMNYASPITMPLTVMGSATMGPRDQGFRGMSVYTEQDGTQALYVSGLGLADMADWRTQVLPPSLLRSTDGRTFQAVPADPFTTMGDINVLTTTNTLPDGMRDQASLHGYFYVSITNGQGNGTLFASPTPQLGDNAFKQITPQSMAVWALQPFNNHLYFGVASPAGYSVWRTDCTAPPPGYVSCPPTAFTQVIPPGAGLPHNQSEAVTSMQVFTDTAGIPHLYVGAAAAVAANPGPAEVTRVNTDDSWDVVVGMTRTVNGQEKDPLSGLGAGFNWPFNMHMWRMAAYQGVLYIGTFDASTSAVKGTPKQEWFQPWLGCDLYASSDGMHFWPVTLNGFGDMYDEGVRALVSTPYGLFVGVANHWYGLRVFQGAVPPQALHLAPGAVQAAPLAGGRVAVAWEAPPRATLFHIYRAEARQELIRFPLGVASAATMAAAGPAASTGVGPRRFVTRMYWMPSGYHEVATTATPFFVDHNVPVGEHVSYYIIAEDADAHLSAPSPLVAVPLLGQTPTFDRVQTLLGNMVAHGAIAARQAVAIRRAIQEAEQRLSRGAVATSRTTLSVIGRLVLSSARTTTAQRYAEELDSALSDLSLRETLVSAHVLRAAQLNTAAAANFSIDARNSMPGHL